MSMPRVSSQLSHLYLINTGLFHGVRGEGSHLLSNSVQLVNRAYKTHFVHATETPGKCRVLGGTFRTYVPLIFTCIGLYT